MQYDFQTIIDRKKTGSLKWDKYKNTEILPMWVADMEFTAAPEILHALHQRIEHGVMGYTIPFEEVNNEVKTYLKRVHHLEIETEWIFWIPGMVQGLLLNSLALAKPGEGIMTATPIYPPFLTCPQYAKRRTIEAPLCLRKNRWTFDFDEMEKVVTPDTRVFMLCNPHNPVGRVFNKKELELLLDFCERHQLILCSDEIHCDLILDKLSHIPALSLRKNAPEYTITLMSPSKTYNLPGLACAYMIIPNPGLRAAIKKAARGIVTEINPLGFAGCMAAYRHGEAWRKELLNTLRKNRNLLSHFISEHLSILKMWSIEATYLAWIDARGLNEKDPVSFYEQKGVGLSNGSNFGNPGYIRLNFGCATTQLQQALERMISP